MTDLSTRLRCLTVAGPDKSSLELTLSRDENNELLLTCTRLGSHPTSVTVYQTEKEAIAAFESYAKWLQSKPKGKLVRRPDHGERPWRPSGYLSEAEIAAQKTKKGS